MNSWRPQLYRSEGRKKEVDQDILKNAVIIGSRIIEKHPNVYPIFTLNHLATLSNVSLVKLRKVVSRNESSQYFYRLFLIKKRTKKKSANARRLICVPDKDLMRVQKTINYLILSNIATHSASFAYAKGSSILDAANVHTGCQWLIKLDIRDFFDSISEKSVYKFFTEVGFTSLLSFEMARICTRVTQYNRLTRGWTGSRDKPGNISSYSSYFRPYVWGSLPQGAPTSPMLANLYARDLDNDITNIALEAGLEYTRYADDITLSTTRKNFSRKQAMLVIRQIYSVIHNYGFNPNYSKTSISPPGARKVVLGLLVNGPSPRLTRDFRNRVKQHLHFCTKSNFGPVNHARHKGFSSVLGFKHHLSGLITYAELIEPDFGTRVRQLYNQVNWPL